MSGVIATGVVQRRSPAVRGRVELGHELPVCGPGGIEVLVVFFELETQVGGVLFEVVHAENFIRPGGSSYLRISAVA
jgi:hypothetical protein